MVYAPDGSTRPAEAGDVQPRSAKAPRLSSARPHLPQEEDPQVQWDLRPGAWSPQGHRFVAVRADNRDVHSLPVVDYTQATETWRLVPYAKTGGGFPHLSLWVFEPESHASQRIEIHPDGNDQACLFPVGWLADGEHLRCLRLSRRCDRLELIQVEVSSGAVQVLLTEESATFVAGLDFLREAGQKVYTPDPGDDSRFLWLSERNGWRQVELIQLSPEGPAQRTPLTEGDFPVQEVVGLHADGNTVFFLANRDPERPYDTHLYRVELDGSGLQQLTEGSGEHEVTLSPSGEVFLDRHSSLERPPKLELRSTRGESLALLEESTPDRMQELGWIPPEEFWVTAADGKTPLRGVLFRPFDFDPMKRYPVVDFIYSGPFLSVAPNDYRLSTHLAPYAQAFAQMGFCTFILDPRGTTERGKAFQDATFGRIGELEIQDHVSAVEQLCDRNPFLDRQRVGIYGHSWGGYFALRAMLTAGDVFHAGVAGAPGALTEAGAINEPYMGLPTDRPEAYAAAANEPLAAGLHGPLLMIHGTEDVNAPFSTTMRMTKALIDADRDFELLVIPGGEHSFRGRPWSYEARRIREFFQEHLGVPQSQSRTERLQAELDAIASEGSFPGATVSLILPDGEEIHLAVGVTEAGGRPLTPDDRMLAGSVGKTWVSALAMQLIEEGALALDDQVAPWFGGEAWFEQVPNGAELTVSHLLRHQSGMERYEFKPAFWSTLAAEPDRHWKPEELLAFVACDEPMFPAGKGWAYADTNYILMGLLMERVTGQPYYRMVQLRFLEPLGLRDTLPSDHRKVPGVVQGQVLIGQGLGVGPQSRTEDRFSYNVQFEWCGGGFASTARDLARWAYHLYRPQLLGEEGLDRLLQAVDAPALGPGRRYGHGVILTPTSLGVLIGHGGFMPGYRTAMGYFPEQGVAAAIQVNCDDERRVGMPLTEVLVRLVSGLELDP